MYNWSQMAHLIYINYGDFVDWEERFFVCPECGEPVYECDWADEDLIDGRDDYICPICESVIQ